MKTSFILFLLVMPILLEIQEIQLYEMLNYKNAVENGTRSRDGRPGPNNRQEVKTVRIDPESIPDMDHSNNVVGIN